MDSIDGTYTNNPECRDGKHGNCDGTGWDLTADMPCPCRCQCHVGEEPDATCEVCGHFYNRTADETTCSEACEILKAHDDAVLGTPDQSPVQGLGGF